MKKALIISAIVLLAGVAACNKTDSVLSGEGQIRFAPASVETRAIVEDAAGLQAQTFQVYDFMGDTKYIDDQIKYNTTEETWEYVVGDFYLWKSGSHKMFGYTASAGELDANKKVTFSKVLTTDPDDQVDFLYSQIVSQTAAQWKAVQGNTPDTPVALNFKHTLAAVSITVKNATASAVTLNSVGAAIKNSGSVTVDFSGEDPVKTYGEVSASTTPFISATALENISLPADGLVDVLSQAVTNAEDGSAYMVVWPQTLEDGDQVVNVNYTMNDQNYNKAVKIPAVTWESGKKYTYVLNIYPTNVELTFIVQPWEKVEVGSLDTKTGSINMSNVTWMNRKVKLTEDGDPVNTLDMSAYSVYMYHDPYYEDVVSGEWVQYEGYYPAQAFFTVNYPVSGKFKIGLIPAYGETTVDEDAYEIWIYDKGDSSAVPPIPGSFRLMDNENGEDITNDTVYFQVRAAAGQDGTQHEAQINIWFKPDGSNDWVSAYSEIRANYACVIPAV